MVSPTQSSAATSSILSSKLFTNTHLQPSSPLCRVDYSLSPFHTPSVIHIDLWGFTPWIMASLNTCGSHPINSLAPGKFEWNFSYVIFKQILVIDGWWVSCEIVLIGMSLDFSDDQSTLVQVMAWCGQATSHCLSQCWPRSRIWHH